MTAPNFSSLAGLEVAEKFVVVVVGGWVEHMTTVSNSNASCFRVGLSWVELRWVLTICLIILLFCPNDHQITMTDTVTHYQIILRGIVHHISYHGIQDHITGQGGIKNYFLSQIISQPPQK